MGFANRRKETWARGETGGERAESARICIRRVILARAQSPTRSTGKK